MAPPVFKTGLAANIVAGGFDFLPSPPENRSLRWASCNSAMQSGRGGESAYEEDLKFSGGQPPCGFESRPRHSQNRRLFLGARMWRQRSDLSPPDKFAISSLSMGTARLHA